MPLVDPAIATLLDAAAEEFQRELYIRYDPISIPHGFDDPRDQEIIGLFAAILAWGRRDTMLRKLEELCDRMSYRPARFVSDFRPGSHGAALSGFKHRTFQTIDALHLCNNLGIIVRREGSLESLISPSLAASLRDIGPAIETLSTSILTAAPETPHRLRKHLARPSTGGACKRLSMYFRWMARPGPFDLGAWTKVDPSLLVLPLDVHSARQARRFGLLSAAANNWKSALALTKTCRTLRAHDPCVYDFALFGLGAYDVPEELAAMIPPAFATEPTSL